jgi:hypothetical protein
VTVGGSGLAFFAGQYLCPALTDALLSIPRLGIDAFRSSRPDDGMDNIDAPMVGPGQVHGSYPGQVLRRSVVTAVLSRIPRPGQLLAGALTTLRRARAGVPPAPRHLSGVSAANPSPRTVR